MKSAGHYRWWNVALFAPLLLFLAATFLLPVALMLARGVTNPEFPAAFPQSAPMLARQTGNGFPDDTTIRAFAAELAAAREAGTLSQAANRLNYDIVGSRSLILDTAEQVAAGAPVEDLADMKALDPRWGQRETWSAIRNAAKPVTGFYIWAALDRRVDAEGQVRAVPATQQVFANVFARTFKISLFVTLFCIVLGYPVAYLLAHLPARIANWLLILVLLPFWTSALVRTTAWVVLLQTNGVVNSALQSARLIEAPLPLIYNRLGVYIAMTHVLLPFFILPLYGVMKRIPPAALRAAHSLGAPPFTAFRKVYLPQTLPGVAAGGAIVFTLALGYYITPALVGGGGDQMISESIVFYVNKSLNWGMAAALSLLLLIPFALILLAAHVTMRKSLLR